MNTTDEYWRARVKRVRALATAFEDAKLRDAMRRIVKRWLASQRARAQKASERRVA